MKTLKIPDVWLMGYCAAHPGATVQDAIAWWLYQERLEVQWLEQQEAISPTPLLTQSTPT